MEISAKKREITGSKVSRRRREGFIPAVIFSKKHSVEKTKPLNIELDAKEFENVFKEAGESTLITVKFENDHEHTVLVSDVQRHPVTLRITHASLYEVDLKEKITATVEIEIINEDKCSPIQTGEGIAITVLPEVEVNCLPADIPHKFEADISKLSEIGATLHIKDLQVDASKVEIMADPEEVIAKIDFAEQLEVEEEEKTVEDVEVTTEKEEEEGEKTAEDSKESTEEDKGEKSADGKVKDSE